jgi:divalent metal cation (Fe/Co/Zn/Cd) transporter
MGAAMARAGPNDPEDRAAPPLRSTGDTGRLSTMSAIAAGPERSRLVARGVRLEILTIGWNVVEGTIGVAAAMASGSVALLGFAIDSFVESASGLVLLWRLGVEHAGAPEDRIEAIERRAERLVGLSLLALAAFVAAEATIHLRAGERPEASPVGIALTSVSLGLMWWLARAKRQVAGAIGSRALAADATQTLACLVLSAVVLAGIALNAAFGWWWADPVSALAMSILIAREGVEAWRDRGDTEGGTPWRRAS